MASFVAGSAIGTVRCRTVHICIPCGPCVRVIEMKVLHNMWIVHKYHTCGAVSHHYSGRPPPCPAPPVSHLAHLLDDNTLTPISAVRPSLAGTARLDKTRSAPSGIALLAGRRLRLRPLSSSVSSWSRPRTSRWGSFARSARSRRLSSSSSAGVVKPDPGCTNISAHVAPNDQLFAPMLDAADGDNARR